MSISAIASYRGLVVVQGAARAQLFYSVRVFLAITTTKNRVAFTQGAYLPVERASRQPSRSRMEESTSREGIIREDDDAMRRDTTSSAPTYRCLALGNVARLAADSQLQ